MCCICIVLRGIYRKMVVKVAVLGAGINGLSCAVQIKEKYKDYQVVLISRDFSPNTTGDGAGGLWYPYLCGSTPEHLITKWGGESYSLLHQLWLSGSHDICLQPCYSMYLDKNNWRLPEWAKVVFGFRVLDHKYLEYLRELYSVNYEAGQVFTTFVLNPSAFMDYLLNRFTSSDGKVLEAKLGSLEDPILESFDVIVNCLGVDAKYVVPDDDVHPIRGQVSKVIAPWLSATIIEEDGNNYIIPNVHTCIMGGTHQKYDGSTQVNDKDTAAIAKECHNIIPSLEVRHLKRGGTKAMTRRVFSMRPRVLNNAKIVSHWAGLRPGRFQIRLEAERRNGKLVIHNYGHGGSGLTLFWGCASEVTRLLEEQIDNHNKSKL